MQPETKSIPNVLSELVGLTALLVGSFVVFVAAVKFVWGLV